MTDSLIIIRLCLFTTRSILISVNSVMCLYMSHECVMYTGGGGGVSIFDSEWRVGEYFLSFD